MGEEGAAAIQVVELNLYSFAQFGGLLIQIYFPPSAVRKECKINQRLVFMKSVTDIYHVCCNPSQRSGRIHGTVSFLFHTNPGI